MGQNMVGWRRLKVRGEAGTAVKMRFAEVVNPDGSLYLANIRKAKVTDVYTLKGGAEEVWEPRFTYHGFRFVEVTGFPGTPDLNSLEGCVVHDDLAKTGDFECSNDLVNQIYRNIEWGTRGNYRSMPTDCPQRDERHGWMGDRGMESRGEANFYNISAFYSKWVQDMADSQREDGSIPDVCPPYWPLYNDNITWDGCAVLIPGNIYDMYGDVRVLEGHYPAMVKWLEHIKQYEKDGLMPRDTYGDWCVPPEDPKLIHSQDPARKTSPVIMGTTYYYRCLAEMARYAKILGKEDDAARFAAHAALVKDAFNAAFYNKERGCYDNGSQTSCILPLAFGMVPEAERARVFEFFVHKVSTETNFHVGTGLVGGQWLNTTLESFGRSDISYRFLTNTDYPSWGFMAKEGATTIWELWNGNTADPAMNSGNHVMLVGDLVTWLYGSIGGIAVDPAIPAYKQILMRPRPQKDLQWVRACHVSPYGKISSEWKFDENGAFVWEVVVPPNSSATVFIPSASADLVTESGTPLEKAPFVKVLSCENGEIAAKIPAGAYHFCVRKP